MTPEQAGHELREAVVRIPGGYMTAGSTYARGSELGFQGADFYLSGRAGVLGEVPADVVVAALVFFAPDLVHEAWARTAAILPRVQAANEWAAAGHAWAIEHLPDEIDWPTVAALLGRVVQAAPVAAAPLFAGWRVLAEPEDPKALSMHRLNALRELRGALHGAAVLTVGLTPIEAIVVRTPTMASVFGWPEPFPEPKPLHDRWGLAEARTDRMFGRNLAVLDDQERDELVELLAPLAVPAGAS
jgi:helix-turn-helix protein